MNILNMYLVTVGLLSLSTDLQAFIFKKASESTHVSAENDIRFAKDFLMCFYSMAPRSYDLNMIISARAYFMARGFFEGKTDSQIEQEIADQPNKKVAIRMYQLAMFTIYTKERKIALKPLEELLGMPRNQIISIAEDPDQREATSLICKMAIGKISGEDIESQVKDASKSNENMAFGMYDLACSCGRVLKPYNQIVPGTYFPSSGGLGITWAPLRV